MQANDGDNDSEHLPGTQERPQGGARGAGLPPVINNATVHELNQIKTEALRDINEGGFSCVTSLSLLPASGLLILPQSWFHLKLCFVASAGFFADA
jgi:hypothetical protein